MTADLHGRVAISLVCGHLVMDADARAVSWKGRFVPLPATVFLMVNLLAKHPGMIKTRQYLLDEIHAPRGADPFDRAIDTTVRRARRAFERVDADFAQIVTVYGVGYMWGTL